jgi:hypothetical protein
VLFDGALVPPVSPGLVEAEREGGRVLVINEQFCFSKSLPAFSLVAS